MRGKQMSETLNAVFGQPPKAAIEHLQSKQVMPSMDWQEVLGNAHNRAFVVAQMVQLDLLEDVRKSLVDALAKNWTFEQWQAQIAPTMQAKGWWGKQIRVDADGNARSVQLGSPHRLKTIYETNISNAYERGRNPPPTERELLLRPYAMYSAIRDNRTRPAHAALHGRVFRRDDPIWSAIQPKNGYRCRCTSINLSAGQVTRGGYTPIDDLAPYTSVEQVEVGQRSGNPRIVERTVVQLPNLPAFKTDAGWGGAHKMSVTQQILNKAAVADPNQAAKIINAVTQSPAALQTLNTEFRQFAQPIINQIPAAGQPAVRLKMTGDLVHVGAVPPLVVQSLVNMGKPLKSAVISVRDEDVVHALRPAKHNPVDAAWYLDLPKHLAAPQAVLLDTLKGDDALVFVYAAGNDRTKLVVMTDHSLKTKVDGERVRVDTNVVRTAQQVPAISLGLPHYVLLFGVL